jgi:hypothetical protein
MQKQHVKLGQKFTVGGKQQIKLETQFWAGFEEFSISAFSLSLSHHKKPTENQGQAIGKK